MRIGIIGAGQLGRMLALAGYPLGLRFVFVDQSEDAPGGQVGRIVQGGFDDAEALARLADQTDLVTFDVENVPVEAAAPIAERVPFLPPVSALGAAQDRLAEKTLFEQLGIPVPESMAVDSLEDLRQAVGQIGLPAVLKTRRLGYDGRGQQVLRTDGDVTPAWEALGGVPLILEAFVPFESEVSLVGVRSTSGEQAFYPLAENVHENGILKLTRAPFRDARLQAAAEDYMGRLLGHFDYAGVLTVEFFVRDGRLLANEMAPRVHNSGHWTIEGAVTSQFENHIRAILGLPLGETRALGDCAMVNYLGELPPLPSVLAVPGAHFHSYGKSPRPLRKLGHCTIVAPSPEAREAALKRLDSANSVNRDV